MALSETVESITLTTREVAIGSRPPLQYASGTARTRLIIPVYRRTLSPSRNRLRR